MPQGGMQGQPLSPRKPVRCRPRLSLALRSGGNYDHPVSTKSPKTSTRKPSGPDTLDPDFVLGSPEARIYVGDCRKTLPRLSEITEAEIDLVFADPPFNWNRAYDQWDDSMPREDYLKFTREWLDVCVDGLAPHGSMWVNIPDDTCAEIVMHLKGRGLSMVNWCIWHYRFGQNTNGRFISSHVHALYFAK